jgi:hypothetical protein
VDNPGKGAFYATDFDFLLKNHGIKHLIICGVTTSFIVRPGEMMLGVFQGVGFGQGFLDGQTDNITPVLYILLHGRACTQYILGFDTSQDF